MRAGVVVAAMVLQAGAWSLVAAGRMPFWATTAAIWAVAGLAAVLVGDPTCCREAPAATAVAAGLVSGATLYAATRVVVALGLRALPALAPVVRDVYAFEGQAVPSVVWTVTLLIVVPAEELFWRGVALPELQRVLGTVLGAVLAWLAAAAVSASWASLPFLAAAVVGGAVWTALAVWSGGVVAPLASHALWTAAMIAWRPGTARAKVPS